MTFISANWDIQQGRCKKSPSCELWDEDMLLRQQEREPEPEPNRERVAPPPMQPMPQHYFNDPVLFDDPIRFANRVIQQYFDDDSDDSDYVPHRRERNQADFDWMREPGRCNSTVL